MTIEQLAIYREKIRSVSVPEAVHYLLEEIDRFMDENDHLTRKYNEDTEMQYNEIGHLRGKIEELNAENTILREALEKIASYDCSWHSVSRFCDCESCIAKQALQRRGGGE